MSSVLVVNKGSGDNGVFLAEWISTEENMFTCVQTTLAILIHRILKLILEMSGIWNSDNYRI